mgnify:CR=1 FL=1
MNSDKALKFISHPIFLMVFTIIGVIAAILVDSVQGLLSITSLTIGYIGVFVLVLFTVVTTLLLTKSKQKVEFEDRLSDLKNIIVASNMTWLVSRKYVSEVEKRSVNTWVFNFKLENDLKDDDDIGEAIKDSLKNGHKYIYFLPDNASNVKDIALYHEKYSFAPNQVVFYLINPDEFSFYTEVTIYQSAGKVRRVIEWLPVDSLDFFVEMDDAHADIIISIGHQYMRKYQPFSLKSTPKKRTEASRKK